MIGSIQARAVSSGRARATVRGFSHRWLEQRHGPRVCVRDRPSYVNNLGSQCLPVMECQSPTPWRKERPRCAFSSHQQRAHLGTVWTVASAAHSATSGSLRKDGAKESGCQCRHQRASRRARSGRAPCGSLRRSDGCCGLEFLAVAAEIRCENLNQLAAADRPRTQQAWYSTPSSFR